MPDAAQAEAEVPSLVQVRSGAHLEHLTARYGKLPAVVTERGRGVPARLQSDVPTQRLAPAQVPLLQVRGCSRVGVVPDRPMMASGDSWFVAAAANPAFASAAQPADLQMAVPDQVPVRVVSAEDLAALVGGHIEAVRTVPLPQVLELRQVAANDLVLVWNANDKFAAADTLVRPGVSGRLLAGLAQVDGGQGTGAGPAQRLLVGGTRRCALVDPQVPLVTLSARGRLQPADDLAAHLRLVGARNVVFDPEEVPRRVRQTLCVAATPQAARKLASGVADRHRPVAVVPQFVGASHLVALSGADPAAAATRLLTRLLAGVSFVRHEADTFPFDLQQAVESPVAELGGVEQLPSGPWTPTSAAALATVVLRVGGYDVTVPQIAAGRAWLAEHVAQDLSVLPAPFQSLLSFDAPHVPSTEALAAVVWMVRTGQLPPVFARSPHPSA